VITVLGKLKDTARYAGRPGYNVLYDLSNWSQDQNLEWLTNSIYRGDIFLLVSNEVNGFYFSELVWLLYWLRHKHCHDDIHLVWIAPSFYERMLDMPKVEIDKREIVYSDFFKIESAVLRYERFDGKMSPTMRRLKFERGDSVAALLYNIDTGKVILTNQFKYPTYGKTDGWIIETVAGVLEKGESPEDAIRREILEEVGYKANELDYIATFFLSPGGTSERILLYYAVVQNAGRVSVGGGLSAEGEDIQLIEWDLSDFLGKLASGQLADAKTIIAALWLKNKLIQERQA
jgi:nudix-type nucleoside diphosphatase (YffH/AdpP family)